MSSAMYYRHGRFVYFIFFFVVFLTRPVWPQTTDPQDPDYTCSADNPCAVGCCGNFGICGMGPDYCGPGNCVNNCDAKSECDPANWGSTYALAETCPLNVCCSQYGFCGTTTEFCGDQVIANPSCTGTSANQRTVGYYEGWSVTRACDAMSPEAIPMGVYTHINFAFASIDPTTFEVVPADSGDVDLYTRLTNLKAIYPGLQVWISIGGWSMNDPDQPTATTFSDLAGSAQAQAAFSSSLISFMSTYGFDGVDIDWEYPVAPERGGVPADFANYPTWLSNLRASIGAAGYNWGVSMTIPSSFWYLQNFDIVKLAGIIDWFNVMEYDLHGTWDSTDVWIGAFVNAHTNLTEIDESLKLLWRNNIDPSKVVLGLGFYGRSFTLQDPSCIEPGCPFTGGAPAGPCTDSVGTLSFAEIETVISNGATVTLNEAAAVKIVTWDDNWVSYDDAETLKLKIDYANNNCLGGTMIWAASLDDAVGTASNALADAGSGSGSNILTAQDPLGVCALTACIDPSDSPCPSGQSAVYGTPEGCGVTNDQIAQAGTDSTFPSRWYCCPVNAMATCFLETPDPNSEGCSTPACQAGTVAVLTTSSTGGPIGCPNSPKNLCCSAPEELTPRGLGCFWTSCGVNSASTCPSDTAAFVSSTIGQDGSQAACLVGDQTLCCPTPLAIDESTCSWHNDASLRGICLPGCPSGQMEIADDVGQGSCILGSSSYCCDPPASPQSDAAAAVLGFKAVAEEFMTEGACLAVAATKRQQRRDLAPRVTVLNMAQRLVPLLLSFNFEQAQLAFILPFQEAWDAAIATTGSLVPSWASLAKLLTENKDQIQEFFETIADGLCDNILSSTFDPILCSLDTCSGGDLCPISTLDKRLMGATPADVTNQFFSTAGVTNAVGFSDPLTFGPGVVAWWTQVKNLDWWLGSNHGVSSLNTQQAIASSFYIDFDLSPGQNLFTGAGPVWGCTTVAVVSDKGAWTAHFWQSFFEDFGDGNLEDDVLTFLANGNAFEGYPGLVSLASVGGPFHPDNRKFLNVIIMTPQLYVQLKLETWSLPTIVNLPGLEYPSAVASMQLQLSLILGTTTAATVRSYPSDQAIWKYVPYPVAGERGTEVRFIWVLNRSPRLANAPWTGMLTVQRTATNNFDVVPSVRIWVANTVVVTSTW